MPEAIGIDRDADGNIYVAYKALPSISFHGTVAISSWVPSGATASPSGVSPKGPMTRVSRD